MSDNIDVSLKHVSKFYKDTVAVSDISLDVRSGEFISILGPSGCGKTTTLRMIGGFILPDEGNIMIAGQDASQLPPSSRNTNMVFQDYALFPHMTVAQNVAFGLKIKGIKKNEIQARVQSALDLVGLSKYGNRKPGQLSGGQRQRVALARALVLRPVVLLLDEPLGALDAKIRKQMQAELKHLQVSLGQTFVYVTHDQEEAMTMSDRVAIMRGGKLEQVGSPEEVYDHPASLFVAGFLGECVTIRGVCHDTKGTFTCNLGKIEGEFSVKAFTGDAALCIRPEYIHIKDSGEPVFHGDYHFSGIVTEKVFKGLNTKVTVKCGEEFLFAELSGKSSLKVGDNVDVSFMKEHALLLPYEDMETISVHEEVGF
ncbi:MAG: ABC transporter ATP-binding protein [Firmicutes bacterium]|nr:ABC transporter ATP-binding protein [Bacillota bacterium]